MQTVRFSDGSEWDVSPSHVVLRVSTHRDRDYIGAVVRSPIEEGARLRIQPISLDGLAAEVTMSTPVERINGKENETPRRARR